MHPKDAQHCDAPVAAGSEEDTSNLEGITKRMGKRNGKGQRDNGTGRCNGRGKGSDHTKPSAPAARPTSALTEIPLTLDLICGVNSIPGTQVAWTTHAARSTTLHARSGPRTSAPMAPIAHILTEKGSQVPMHLMVRAPLHEYHVPPMPSNLKRRTELSS